MLALTFTRVRDFAVSPTESLQTLKRTVRAPTITPGNAISKVATRATSLVTMGIRWSWECRLSFCRQTGVGAHCCQFLRVSDTNAAVSWVSFVLSRRYLALSPRGQFAALVISILLALETILVAWLAGVTFFDLTQVVYVYWVIAGVCSLCSFLLWRHRRASNNRWRGP